MINHDKLPTSSSNYWINLFCLVFFFASIYFLRNIFPRIEMVQLTVVGLLATFIPLWLYYSIFAGVQYSFSSRLRAQLGEINKERLVIKLIGLYGTFFIVLAYYYLIYTFFAAGYLRVFFDFLSFAYPWIIILCFIYFFEIDRRQEDPYDEYWHAGCFLTGRLKEVDPAILKEYARAWFIKGFFTPYVFVILVNYVESLLSFNGGKVSFLYLHNYFLDLFYTIDIIYGVLGYMFTCRLLDTHIRSTDLTLLGWLVCLICYGPFYNYFGIGLLSYDDGLQWHHWFTFSPALYYFYGTVIIFLTLVYSLATVAIGWRSSNLTYRGIITSGPYRFTKHPAYLCKVLSWWLITLPFFSVESSILAVKHTLSLGVISLIYYLRAKTEENHISNYPEYVEYAHWINKHGIFSPITKYFPALQYSEEKCKQWRSHAWFNKSY